MFNIIELLEKYAPGYTYGLNRDGDIFVNGQKTSVRIAEMNPGAPQETVEAAAEAAKTALIAGSYIEK